MFFHYPHKMKYSCYQDSPVIRSWFAYFILGLRKASQRNSTKLKVEHGGFYSRVREKFLTSLTRFQELHPWWAQRGPHNLAKFRISMIRFMTSHPVAELLLCFRARHKDWSRKSQTLEWRSITNSERLAMTFLKTMQLSGRFCNFTGRDTAFQRWTFFNCGHQRFPHSIPLRKLYFDWWILKIRGRNSRKTLTTLVLKHLKTRHDIPRSCMIFIFKIMLNLLCLVMTFAWKAGYIPSQHSRHSRYIIPLACGLK